MLLTSLFTMLMHSLVLFHFDTKSSLDQWYIVDDVVMGGRSDGRFSLNTEGHGVFAGAVSLENNGGFSSVRCALDGMDVSPYSKFVIQLKGDGKRYQFRVKNQRGDYYAYVQHFETTGAWQQLELSFSELYPSFRGRKLDMDDFSGGTIEEIGFLIANKKAEPFELVLKQIEVQ